MILAVAGPHRAAAVDAFGVLIYVIVITIWLASAINGVIKRARRAGDKAETNARSRAEGLRRRAQMTQVQGPATRPSWGAGSMTIPPQAATLPPTQHTVHFHADEPQVYAEQALDREAAARRSDAMVAFAQQQIDQVAATTAMRPEHGAATYVDSSHVAGWVTRAIVGAAVIGPPAALRGSEQFPVGW